MPTVTATLRAWKSQVKPTQRVLLGITGGIAAYKSAELVRLLVKSGREVTVAMTAAAREFVGPATLSGAVRPSGLQ